MPHDPAVHPIPRTAAQPPAPPSAGLSAAGLPAAEGLLRPIHAAELAALAGIRHGFFTREGGLGHPDPALAGLNCGLGSSVPTATVLENRSRVAANLGIDRGSLLSLHQIHSPEVVVVESPWPQAERHTADAMVTRRPGIGLGILTADCAPVLFADAQAQVIGAAHAGWKGALAGVVAATVAAMIRLGAEPARIVAAIGPTIAQASYEVGPDLEEKFTTADPGFARFFVPGRGDRRQFDLPGFLLDRLRAAGVTEAVSTGHDTLADPARFFSYRRACLAGGRDYGRLIAVIALA